MIILLITKGLKLYDLEYKPLIKENYSVQSI